MLNPIIEEALANIIRRLNDLEEKISRLSIPDKNGYHQRTPDKQKGMSNATVGQIKYIKALGGKTHEDMSKQEAGKEIDRLLAIKDAVRFEEDIQANVDEPEEVNTDEAGIDDQGLM